MSQNTARHDPHARSREEEDADPQASQPERRQALPPQRAHQGAGQRRTVGQPGDNRGVGPDEPDEDELELIGDNDLGAADLGPIGPNVTDPDGRSGRPRK